MKAWASKHSGIISGQSRPNRPQLAKLVEAPRCNPLHMQLSVDCHSKTRDVMGRWNPVTTKQNLCHSDISHYCWREPTQINWVLSEFNRRRLDAIHVLSSSMQVVSRLASVAHWPAVQWTYSWASSAYECAVIPYDARRYSWRRRSWIVVIQNIDFGSW